MTQTETKTFFNDEVHADANRLRLVVEELEGAADDLRTARARHQRAELDGDRSELVSSMRSLAECEAVHGALQKQHAAMASHLADSLRGNYHAAKKSAEADDLERKQAGREAMESHLQDALESIRAAKAAFLSACGGDETSALTLNRQIKDMVSLLPLESARTIPSPAIFNESRHLCPPQLGDIERVLAALLP